MADVNVIFKTMCLKMIMDYYSSVLSDRKNRERVLSVVSVVASVPRACRILIEGYGLVSWLQGVARRLKKEDKNLFKRILCLVQNVLYSVSVAAMDQSLALVQKYGKSVVDLPEMKLDKDLEHDLVVILGDMISFVEYLEVDDLVFYLKTYNLLAKRTVKLLSKKQLLYLIAECEAFCKESECLSLLNKAVASNMADVLKCKSLNKEDSSNVIQELKCLVSNYIM